MNVTFEDFTDLVSMRTWIDEHKELKRDSCMDMIISIETRQDDMNENIFR